MLQSTRDFLTQIEKAVNLGIPVSIVDMAFSNGSDNTLVYGLYQDKMMYRLAAYNGWNTASNSVGYGIAQGVLSKNMTADAHRDMLTTQYLDNWAYQANVRDYIYRMQQKLEAGVVTQYYPTLNEELQSRTKEQLQRYASTYLGIDPKTVDVTLPWQRLFEVYVDVKPAPVVPLESDVRHDMNRQALQNLANEVSAAQAQLDASQTVNADGTVTPADPAVQAQLQAAKAAAQARYEQEKQAQAINHSEEKAQQSRTWAAQK